MKTYTCKICKESKAPKFFHKKDVVTLDEIDEIQELICVDCKDVGDVAAKEYYCSGCEEKRPFSAFLAVMRKKILGKWSKDQGL